MTDFLRETLETDLKIGKKFTIKLSTAFFLIIVTFVAILTRFSLFDYQSSDYLTFLSPWFDELMAAGGLPGIGISLGDYTPPYIYIMSLLTYIPIKSLYSIKIVSCIFDIICAICVALIIFKVSKSQNKAILGYSVILFAPTVLLNGSFWGQCDIIFTTFLMLCLLQFLKNKPFSAMIFFSIAFCFKLQAIFLAPLLIFLWIDSKVKLRHFLLIPVVYLVSILPAFFAGRPFIELLKIYISQSGQYSKLSMNAPNPFLFFGNGENTAFLSSAGITVCFIALLTLFYFCYKKQVKFDKIMILRFALLCSILIPFLLPHMHERYFFIADIISIIYAICIPKRFYVAILCSLSSLICYIPYLFWQEKINLLFTPFMMLFVLITVFKDIQLASSQSN